MSEGVWSRFRGVVTGVAEFAAVAWLLGVFSVAVLFALARCLAGFAVTGEGWLPAVHFSTMSDADLDDDEEEER